MKKHFAGMFLVVAAINFQVSPGNAFPLPAAAPGSASVTSHGSPPPMAETTMVRHRQARSFRAAANPPALQTLPAFHDMIVRHAEANGVPVPLAIAVVQLESRFNPRIVHAGNYGLMQIKPQTARGVGFAGAPGNLLDPETNLRFGMKYLGSAYHLAGGDTCHTIMRYQSGIRATHLSAANRAYCARALRLMSSN